MPEYTIVKRKGYTDRNGREVPPTVVRVPKGKPVQNQVIDFEDVDPIGQLEVLTPEVIKSRYLDEVNQPTTVDNETFGDERVVVRRLTSDLQIRDAHVHVEEMSSDSTILAVGDSKVTVRRFVEGSKVELRDRSEATVDGAGSVEAHDDTKLSAKNEGDAVLNDRAQANVTFFTVHGHDQTWTQGDCATVHLTGNAGAALHQSDGTLRGNSYAEGEGCDVIATGDSTFVIHDFCVVKMHDNAKVHVLDEADATEEEIDIHMYGGELIVGCDKEISVSGYDRHVNVRAENPDEQVRFTQDWEGVKHGIQDGF